MSDTGRLHYFSCECGFRSDPYDKAAVDAHLENFHPYRPLKENDGAPTK